MILTENILENVLTAALSNGADFAEVFLENTYKSMLTLKDSKPSESNVGRLYGAGIRLIYGTEQIYTYTNDLREDSLINTALIAAKAIKADQQLTLKPLTNNGYDSIHTYSALPWDISKEKKISFLKRSDQTARAVSSDVTQVMNTITEVHQQIQVANSMGRVASETRQYTNFSTSSILEAKGEKEIGFERVGHLASSDCLEEIDYEGLATTATKRAITNLTADFAPAGEMPVVIDNGFGGVIFHEACGHGLETTSIAKNASVFCNKLNERLAEPCVTAIDDGTISNTYGSLMIDDEGMKTQKTTLIENGILKSYLVDYLGHKKTGYEMTGSGRRENYRFAPTSRMRNTFIAPGKTELSEMISSVDHGIYAKRMGGGSVTPGTGAYNFSVTEAYMIKNGKLGKPVKGASLIGTGIDTLGKIKQVGTELSLAAGTCGSISGMIPTTVGQPAILVDNLTVGGRA